MRNKYGIGFFATAIIAMLVITCAYQFSFHKAKEQAKKNHAQKEQQEIEEESGALVEADGEAMKEDCYYLMEVNGYVVVYLSDKVTPYEYTAIAYDELPPTVRAEVRNGKYIESPEELYGFLENYSS